MTKIDDVLAEFDKKFKKISGSDPIADHYHWIKSFIRQALEEQARDIEMTESIKRYNQAKEDGTLDKHFPKII